MKYSTASLPSHYQAAFKDADIRGVYPTEIDEVSTYRTARAFVELFGLKEVLVARDMRESSLALRDAFVAGARDSGADVIDIGLVGTPALYYASGKYDRYGVMITASHNPKEYNGLKLVQAGAIPLTRTTGLSTIQKRVATNEFSTTATRGRIKKKSIVREYLRYIRSRAGFKSARPLRVVVDAGNGMASTLSPLWSAGGPLKVTPLFFDLDGTFPNRESNPTLAKNQKAIKAELKKGTYDFGVSFDGDADRVAFFDERGRYINSAVIGALIAKHLLANEPGSAHVYTVFTSKVYEETICVHGGRAVRARVGHAFIKEAMRKKDAIFGCEHSAHFYFKDNFFTDSGILAFLYVAAMYAEVGVPFSQLVKPFQYYHQTEEILVQVTSKPAALKAVADHYAAHSPLAIERYDGVTIKFTDYWLVVKASVTEDALKCVVESTSVAKAKVEHRKLVTFLQQQ